MPRRWRSASRAGQGLTTRGRCLLAGGLAAIACAIVLDERDLLRVGILAAALPLVAFAVIFGRPLAFTATYRAHPERLTPGARGTAELRLSNAGSRSSPAIVVTDRPVDGLSDGVRCTLPPLKPGAVAVVRYGLAATRRGRYSLGDVSIRNEDPLGLCARTATASSAVDILVMPTVVPLTGLPTSSGSRTVGGGAAAGAAPGGDPDVRVRPYVSGDDVRTIHWRASARRDDLVVRTRQPTSHGSATVLVDHRAAAHAGLGQGSSVETAVTLAASVAAHVISRDYELTLRTHTGEILASGTDVWQDVLVGLALLPDADDDAVTCGRVAASGLTAAVTGALTHRDVARLVAIRPAGGRAIALLLDTTTWGDLPAGRDTLPAAASAAALREGGWTTVILHRGDDLAAAWRTGHADSVVPQEAVS